MTGRFGMFHSMLDMCDALLQRQRELCNTNGMSYTSGRSPACPEAHPVSVTTMPSSVAAQLSGRSPALVAMERVVPKYASWASSDINATRWHHVRDRRNVVDQYSLSGAVMQADCSPVASACRNTSAAPVHHLPDLAATAGCVVAGGDTPVTMPDNGTGGGAQEELRAHLCRRPAADSSLHNVSQVGEAGCMLCTALSYLMLSLSCLYDMMH